MFRIIASACIALVATAPAVAATPRQTLINAAFFTHDKPSALLQIGQADAAAASALVRAPGDREALMMRAMAMGYSAKLNRSRTDALAARKLFEALVASDPRDPEAQVAVGGWHLDAIADLGGFVAGTAIGAKKALGLAAIDRAVALGGSRAMFTGLAAMLRLSIDGKDKRALALAEAASRGATPGALDRVMQRGCTALLPFLRAGDHRGAQLLAKRLLPFGQIAK